MLSADLPKFTAALKAVALDPNHRDHVKVLIWMHQTLGISPITKAEIRQQIEVTTTFDREKALAELQQIERDFGVRLLPRSPREDEEFVRDLVDEI